MKGFKSSASAEVTIAGIELHHMLKKVNIKVRLIYLFMSNFMRLRPNCSQGYYNLEFIQLDELVATESEFELKIN